MCINIIYTIYISYMYICLWVAFSCLFHPGGSPSRAILYGTTIFFAGGHWRCFFHAEKMSNEKNNQVVKGL